MRARARRDKIYAVGSSFRVSRQYFQVKCGQMVKLRPSSSRYQLLQPDCQTVPCEPVLDPVEEALLGVGPHLHRAGAVLVEQVERLEDVARSATRS